MTMKLIHTAIKTGNLAKSLDFYINILGFTVREKRYIEAHKTTLAFLSVPGSDMELELIAEDNPDFSNTGKGAFAHFGFRTEDIDSDVNALKKRGVYFTREPFYSMDKSMKLAFFEDPDGIMIELIQYL